MKKVDLNYMENKKYKIIKRLVTTNGNKKRAANLLNCSMKTIYRLIRKYQNEGKSGFVHKNRNRTPINKYPQKVKDKILDYYINECSPANISHFAELAEQKFKYKISVTTLKKWLAGKWILSPKAWKRTVKKQKQLLKWKAKNASSIKYKQIVNKANNELDRKFSHPRKPRVENKGQLVLLDATVHAWNGKEKWYLHLAIDDATGHILGGHFDKEETLNGYYHVLKQILVNHGIPMEFLTDRRTVFIYQRKDLRSFRQDTYTQFGFACKQLGIKISSTSVAQAKGRIERMNGTLQSRLPIDMKLNGVKTMDEANKFLQKYIHKINEKFGHKINKTRNVFEPIKDKERINLTLSEITKRKVDNGHAIKVNNKYLIATHKYKQVYLYPGTQVLFVKTFNDKEFIVSKDVWYPVKEIPKYKSNFKVIDSDLFHGRHNHTYSPSPDHVWRQDSFIKFCNKQAYRKDYNDKWGE